MRTERTSKEGNARFFSCFFLIPKWQASTSNAEPWAVPYGEGTLLVSFVNLLEISPKYSIINLVCREPAAWLLVAWLHSVEPLVLSLPINLQKTALVSLTESYVLKVMYSLNLLSVPLGIYYCFFPFFFFFYKLWLVPAIVCKHNRRQSSRDSRRAE